MITKQVWLGADNKFTLQLTEVATDGVTVTPVDLSSVTKMELYLIDIGGTEYSVTSLAADNPRYIDWVTPVTTGNVDFQLGVPFDAAVIPVGTYKAELQVYDPANTNGIVWLSVKDRDLTIKVREKREV